MGWSPDSDSEKPKSGLYLLSQDSPQNLKAVGWALGPFTSLTKGRNMFKVFIQNSFLVVPSLHILDHLGHDAWNVLGLLQREEKTPHCIRGGSLSQPTWLGI